MIAEINPDALVLLKFSKKEIPTKLRWEHSKEFEYDGQMYDIVDVKVKGDSIFYRCWWDHEETALNKKLKKLVALAFDKHKSNRDSQTHLYVYLRSFFITKHFEWQSMLLPHCEYDYNCSLTNIIFNSLRFSPPTPPPKVS